MPGWYNGQYESLWNSRIWFNSKRGYQKMNKEKKLVPGLPSGFEDRWDKKLLLKKKLLKAIENNFIKFGAEALETPSFEISENIGSFLQKMIVILCLMYSHFKMEKKASLFVMIFQVHLQDLCSK